MLWSPSKIEVFTLICTQNLMIPISFSIEPHAIPSTPSLAFLGLAFRLNRICSTPAAFNTRVTELKGFLKTRGYPRGTVERQINKALIAIPRSEALKRTNTDSDTRLDRVSMVITYHPSLPKLTQIIHKHLPILHSSDVCRKAIPKPPMVAYRRGAIIKDLVVYSPSSSFSPRGSFACGQCKSCSHKQHPREMSHTTENATFTSTSSMIPTQSANISVAKLKMLCT